jgi:tetratricopeptide (TPR) repeat protein
VRRGKKLVKATFYAGDRDKDVCLLEAKGIGGKPVKMGEATSLKVGETVYAIGAPHGLELSLSNGIVSQLRGNTPPLIQTTAAISPGSSGGGLFDSKAQLVGLTTLFINDGQSLNFALPVEWLANLKPERKIAIESDDLFGRLDWVMRAAALEEKQDWYGLLALGTQWVSAETDSSHAWDIVGEAYENLNQPDQAITAYSQSLRINPEGDVAWGGLGNNYAKLNRHDEAIAAYRQALRINPGDAGNWYSLGLTYGRGPKRWSDAIEALHQALRINPEHTNSLKALALSYYLSGNAVAALEAARSLRDLDPEKAEEVFNIVMPR